MRRALVVLSSLLVFACLTVAVVLGPAHLQIRGIAPALPSVSELRALTKAQGGPVSIGFVDTASQPIEQHVLSHTTFVLEWPDRRLFVVDAGMDEARAAEFGELMHTLASAGPSRFHGALATQLGERTARVAGAGFTHLHIDHVQGLTAFCRARGTGASVFQTRAQAEQHNLHTSESAAIVAGSCLRPTMLEGEGLLPIDGFPGLAMVPLGGHTPGSTMFVAAVSGDLWLVSGDIVNAHADIAGDRGKGWLYSNLIVPEDTDRTQKLRRWLATLDAHDDVHVVVSHDSAAAARAGLRALPSTAAR